MATESDVLPRPRRVGRPAIRVAAANLQLRFLAWLIDVILISFAASLVMSTGMRALLDRWASSTTASSTSDIYADAARAYWLTGGVSAAVMLSLALAIVVPSIRVLRATPGQRILGLMTVPSVGTGRLGLARGTLRVLLLYGPWIAVASFELFIFGIGDDAFQDASPSLAFVTVVPWLIRLAALVWYAGLGLSIASAGAGSALHDRLTDAVVLRRFGSA